MKARSTLVGRNERASPTIVEGTSRWRPFELADFRPWRQSPPCEGCHPVDVGYHPPKMFEWVGYMGNVG
jgi:hypothetical protein